MKPILLIAILAIAFSTATSFSGQQQHEAPVRAASAARTIAIIRSINEAKEDGSFNYNFESEDGIKVEATGSQKQIGAKADEIGTIQRGSYSYSAPDGTLITVNWVADENGFQATGDHLPTPPPMPDYVVKMLADLKKREQQQSIAMNQTGLVRVPTVKARLCPSCMDLPPKRDVPFHRTPMSRLISLDEGPFSQPASLDDAVDEDPNAPTAEQPTYGAIRIYPEDM